MRPHRMRPHRLTRSLTDRVLGGVCGGLGVYIGIDPWWVRGAFVVVAVATVGIGVLIYLALWLILPAQTLVQLEYLESAHVILPNPETVILIGAAVIGMGFLVLARNLGVLSGTNGDGFLPLVVIALGVIVLVKELWRTA
jgi:phage shock protein C